MVLFKMIATKNGKILQLQSKNSTSMQYTCCNIVYMHKNDKGWSSLDEASLRFSSQYTHVRFSVVILSA